nr:1-acyl-sn-glycerol-3-phosphate acyltransferase gamma-like [Lytechinus pictus]
MGLVSSIKSSGLVHIWFFCLFVISALIVTTCQCFTLVLWPISKRLYREANGLIIALMWHEPLWLIDYWSGSEVHLYIKDEELDLIGKEHIVLILNHRQDVDWLVTWQVAERCNVLRGAKSLMKNELKYVPFFGWSFYLTEQLFVNRDYAKDKTSLVNHFKNITTFHYPCVTLIFCEGTRFTEEKYKKSQAFAKEKGLPGLKHHLMPRTKGFNLCMQTYKGKVSHIVDATIAYKDGAQSSLYDLLCGKKFEYHVYGRVLPLDEVPTDSEEATAEYCHELYRKKDETFQYFLDHNTFEGYDPERGHKFLPPSPTPKYVMIFWFTVLGIPLIYYAFVTLLSGSTLLILLVAGAVYGVFTYTKSIINVTLASKGSAYGSTKASGIQGVKNGSVDTGSKEEKKEN